MIYAIKNFGLLWAENSLCIVSKLLELLIYMASFSFDTKRIEIWIVLDSHMPSQEITVILSIPKKDKKLQICKQYNETKWVVYTTTAA